MTAVPKPRTRAIVVEETLPHSPELIWKVLTTRELVARWLMQNTFEPGVGNSFTMQAHPMGDWDGTVSCTIFTYDPPRELSYSWVGGSNRPGAAAPALDSTVTWTLTPVADGTSVRMVHDGFVSPNNDMGYEAMSRGWANVVKRIGELAAEL
jgi:uncharacterized protein YndB with AHSA1/START domain